MKTNGVDDGARQEVHGPYRPRVCIRAGGRRTPDAHSATEHHCGERRAAADRLGEAVPSRRVVLAKA